MGEPFIICLTPTVPSTEESQELLKMILKGRDTAQWFWIKNYTYMNVQQRILNANHTESNHT
jgi:hypothetical protein